MTNIEQMKAELRLLERATGLLITVGWYQGDYGIDKDGHELGIDELDRAVCFCSYGAVHRANSELQVFPFKSEDDTGVMQAAEFTAETLLDGDSVIEWNDAPERTKDEVVAQFQAAVVRRKEAISRWEMAA